MRTETITTEVYQFDELSDSAKQTAIDNQRETQEYFHHDENRGTLEKFVQIFPISNPDYEYGGCPCFARATFDESDEIENLSGIRLLAYLQNNYHSEIFKGKYYSLWSKTDANPHYTKNGSAPQGKLKSRHSRIMLEADNCPLTGICTDFNILDPILNFISKPDNTTFGKLMEDCLHSWVKSCSDDWDRAFEDDYLEEEIQANELEFTEEGNQY